MHRRRNFKNGDPWNFVKNNIKTYLMVIMLIIKMFIKNEHKLFYAI